MASTSVDFSRGVRSTNVFERLGDATIVAIVAIAALACVFPFAYVLSYSLMPYEEYLANPTRLIPSSISFAAYQRMLSFPLVYSGFRNSVFITVVGTAINVSLLVLSAYPLSKRDLKGRNLILTLILITMFFDGGIIPNYYLVRSVGLINTLWALIIPTAISAWNLMLMKNFVANIPDSLEESAVMDGANAFQVLLRIIVPLSTPAIATFTLFHAVMHWNAYFHSVIYISKRSLWPIMLVLREMIVEETVGLEDAGNIVVENQYVALFTTKMAIIVIAMTPIIVVYPFLQRYFVKGLLIGSVKG